MSIARTSVFVHFLPGVYVSELAITERLNRLTCLNITRVDYIVSTNGRYSFVYFDNTLPDVVYDMLSYGQTTLDTVEGPFRVSLNECMTRSPNTLEIEETFAHLIAADKKSA